MSAHHTPAFTHGRISGHRSPPRIASSTLYYLRGRANWGFHPNRSPSLPALGRITTRLHALKGRRFTPLRVPLLACDAVPRAIERFHPVQDSGFPIGFITATCEFGERASRIRPLLAVLRERREHESARPIQDTRIGPSPPTIRACLFPRPKAGLSPSSRYSRAKMAVRTRLTRSAFPVPRGGLTSYAPTPVFLRDYRPPLKASEGLTNGRFRAL